MAQPGVFDELSSRINKTKRPDSGIHNSVELSVDEVKTEQRNSGVDELADSGQESADQMDSSANTGKKKQGFLKSFKKIFKKKKSNSSKSTKRKSEDGRIQEQYKSRSETDILTSSGGGPSRQQNKPKRHSEASGLSPKREKVFDGSDVANDNGENSEKKNSLKDAQQYIRSSLRKLKSKKGDKDDADITAESAEIEREMIRSNSSLGNSSFDDEFFSKTLAANDDQFKMTNVPVKLGDIKAASPQIENSVAKDRIRVAPQNRRKPSRYRSGTAPSKPARSASTYSFKEDTLTKIDEDKDNFTGISRNSSSVSRHDSMHDSLPSYSRSNSEDTHRSSFDSTSRDYVPKALINIHSFSTADDVEPRKPRSMAQRSFSTNSRENVNRPKPPLKPPRSAHTSNTSLHNDEFLAKKLSLGELRSKLFYTEQEDSAEIESKTFYTEKKGSFENIKEESRRSSEEKLKNDRNSYGDKRNSYEDKINSYGDKRNSYGDKGISYGDKRSSLGDKRNSYQEKEPQEEKSNSYGDKRYSYGEKRYSYGDKTVLDNEKRNSYGEKRLSSERLFEGDRRSSYGEKIPDNKRDSYGAIIRLSSRTSLNSEATEKKPLAEIDQNIINRPNSNLGYRGSREEIFRSKEDVNKSRESFSEKTEVKNEQQELIFPKTEESSYGMLAYALTSPRQDRKESPPSPTMSRSKSYSEKLEDREVETSNMNTRTSTNSSITNGSKSVGYLNEVGHKSPPVVRQKPATSPRKSLRKSPPTEKKPESEEKAPEFNRISLRKVPKLEDYMGSAENIKSNVKIDDVAPSSEILDFINNELVLDEQPPSKQTNTTPPKVAYSEEVPGRTKEFQMPDFRSSDERMKKKKDLKTNETNELDTNKPSMQFKRTSLKKVDLTPTEAETKHDLLLPDIPKQRPEQEVRRASWKNIEEKQTAESPEFRRHSLKKVEQPSVEETNSFSLPLSREPEAKSEEKLEKPPRPIVKNRPTVHGTRPGASNNNFSFQSNDMSRSKSLGSNDQKRLTEKGAIAVSTVEESKETDSTEPEWFKMARRKQKIEEITDENVSQTSPRSSRAEMTGRPLSPPTKPKPKVSPRPVVSPKPEVSSRPASVSKKPQPTTNTVASPPTRAVRTSFVAKTDVSKDQCVVCGKKAYPIERIDVDRRVVHKNCAKCEECHRKLNIGGIFLRENRVYCSQHN